MTAMIEADEAGDREEAALWAACKGNPSGAAREKLFSLHAGFARGIARRLHREASRGDIELADLNQLAFAGLLEALDRFDPRQGTPFRAFATLRISGSVRDGLKHMSEMREQISWHHRVRRERLQSLTATDTESLGPSEAMDKLAEVAVGLALGFILEGTGMCVTKTDDGEGAAASSATAYDSVAWKQTVEQLHEELLNLTEREQTILRQHYLNGVTFEHLASLAGVTKGRVSQVHRGALLRLRRRMNERGQFRLEK